MKENYPNSENKGKCWINYYKKSNRLNNNQKNSRNRKERKLKMIVSRK